MGKQTKSKRLRAQGRLDPLSASGRVQPQPQPPVADSASAEAQAEETVVQIMQVWSRALHYVFRSLIPQSPPLLHLP